MFILWFGKSRYYYKVMDLYYFGMFHKNENILFDYNKKQDEVSFVW